MTIMIVDDNESIHEIVRDTLASDASTFVDCRDGSEAVELYSRYHPDWVLMDIMMEKMDGFAATEAILAQDPFAKIIIITQHNESAFIERSKQVGARGFVLKENLFDIEQIIESNQN